MDNSQTPAKDLASLNYSAKLSVRQNDCLSCSSNQNPVCPKCPRGQSCIFTIQTCTECPKALCRMDDSTVIASKGNLSGGVIAGGVIGGIVAVSLVTYLFWRFLIKPKRGNLTDDPRTQVYEVERTPSTHTQGVEKNSAIGVSRRASTHTVHSIASTVFTRASNIIQIAYIPGVTNRATPTSPPVLVPPVPPIPAHHSDQANGSEHFFVPGKLRDSTYSGFSCATGATGLTDMTTSYGPRSSIASTLYGRQAEVQTASHGGMRAKPTVVSVKPGYNAPPLPNIDMERFGIVRPDSPASAISVGAATCTTAPGRGQVVKVSGLKKIEIGGGAKAGGGGGGGASPLSTSLSSNTVVGRSKEESGSDCVGTIPICQGEATTPRRMSPFVDPPSSTAGASPLSAIREDGSSDGASWKRGKRRIGPFGDEHATREWGRGDKE